MEGTSTRLDSPQNKVVSLFLTSDQGWVHLSLVPTCPIDSPGNRRDIYSFASWEGHGKGLGTSQIPPVPEGRCCTCESAEGTLEAAGEGDLGLGGVGVLGLQAEAGLGQAPFPAVFSPGLSFPNYCSSSFQI